MFFIKDDPPPLKTHPSFSSIKLLLGPIGERERERDPASERTDSNASVRRRLHRLETCNLDLEFSINPRYMNADGDRDKTVQTDVDPDRVSTTEKRYKMTPCSSSGVIQDPKSIRNTPLFCLKEMRSSRRQSTKFNLKYYTRWSKCNHISWKSTEQKSPNS